MIAFLFAGQGTQTVGMGLDLYEKYDEFKKVYDTQLDFDLKGICLNGPKELLDDTKYAQPAIVAMSLGIARILESKGIKPDYVAGLSLGEYGALAYSNVISDKDAINLVSKRGDIMSNALPKGYSGMAAVLKLDADTIKEVINSVDGILEIANYNCPGQIVITGELDAIDKAAPLLLEKGARRVVKLNVSGAFHSSLLEDASIKLGNEIEKVTINEKQIPVVHNITGTEINDMSIKDILMKQIKSSVYFEQSINYMIEKGVDTFIEVGPGEVLSGHVRKTNSEVKVYSVNDEKSLLKLLEEMSANE